MKATWTTGITERQILLVSVFDITSRNLRVVSLCSIEDPDQRIAMLTQILEFGQTPTQLFNSPHPQRITPRFHNMTRSPNSNSPLGQLSPGRNLHSSACQKLPLSLKRAFRSLILLTSSGCLKLFWLLCCFTASQSEDSSFEDLTEESTKLAWANMGSLKLISSHKIHKE